MAKTPDLVEGKFLQMIYSPRGAYEGVLVEREGASLQLVFDPEDEAAARAFETVRPGQSIRVEAEPQPPSPKGPGDHPVHAFRRLLAVGGRKPALPKPLPAGAAYRGKVVRLNYARHGAANGVVLDTGDFIHLKPAGMKQLGLGVGDAVEADGDAQRLVDDTGWAVEATEVNGQAVRGKGHGPG